jgi:SAM-dependent methyltransferase
MNQEVADPWLERWLPDIAQVAKNTPILELGCGQGDDTGTLKRAGHEIIALDLSADCVTRTQERVPGAQVYHQDLRAPFPVAPGSTAVVLASLSLHYFEWAETMGLVERIHQTLSRPGLFLCRLNSTADHHYGASGHPQISENYYRVNGQAKRFFDRDSVLRLFASGWQIRSLEEQITDKYQHPKALWEIVLEPVE